jgi:hypothetical protein
MVAHVPLIVRVSTPQKSQVACLFFTLQLTGTTSTFGSGFRGGVPSARAFSLGTAAVVTVSATFPAAVLVTVSTILLALPARNFAGSGFPLGQCRRRC